MAEQPIVRIFKEPGFKELPVPRYATPQAAGVDLYAALEASVSIPPGSWRLISTGIRIALPVSYEAQIRPRSGLALKYGVTLLNSPGTIDSDYRGIIGVILINHGEEPFVVQRGDRIAQMVIAPVARLEFELVSYLRKTGRGDGGFGSTGTAWNEDDRTDQMEMNRNVKG
ncbi:dUTP diphosphatase [bacterium]|nr:dUTP diphosphatase [candidate division CSSED10-310 bacterium]